eukprot:6193882-Pleurochrysis_carterae.AAC.3
MAARASRQGSWIAGRHKLQLPSRHMPSVWISRGKQITEIWLRTHIARWPPQLARPCLRGDRRIPALSGVARKSSALIKS